MLMITWYKITYKGTTPLKKAVNCRYAKTDGMGIDGYRYGEIWLQSLWNYIKITVRLNKKLHLRPSAKIQNKKLGGRIRYIVILYLNYLRKLSRISGIYKRLSDSVLSGFCAIMTNNTWSVRNPPVTYLTALGWAVTGTDGRQSALWIGGGGGGRLLSRRPLILDKNRVSVVVQVQFVSGLW
jgi:hypothetical protein